MTGTLPPCAGRGLRGLLGATLAASVLALAAPGARAETAAPTVPADQALWRDIARGGHVLLIRHAATEPGTGDPPEFQLGDCRTQRNLSERGRREAQRLGEAFRAHRVPVAAVRSSPWCRCLDTARLAFGEATPWPALSSLYHDDRQADVQAAEVLALATQVPANENLVLVTHAFNIRALTGISPAPGEIVITRPAPGRLAVVGRLRIAR